MNAYLTFYKMLFFFLCMSRPIGVFHLAQEKNADYTVEEAFFFSCSYLAEYIFLEETVFVFLLQIKKKKRLQFSIEVSPVPLNNNLNFFLTCLFLFST